MNKERKLKGFLVRFLLAGGTGLLFAVMKLLPVCEELVSKIFTYVASDIVFFK